MMSVSLLTFLPVFFQIAVLGTLVVLSVCLIRQSGHAIPAVYLTFILSLWLLTDLYWVIYDFMRPESRMPFAANEIGEAAIFLLEGAMLAALVHGWKDYTCPQAMGALLFAACNVALWIAWSGEWVDDLFVGAAFAVFLYQAARALAVHQSLASWEWGLLGAGCGLLILGQGLTFFVPEAAKAALDTACYGLLAAVTVWWAVKVIFALRKNADGVSLLCLVFAWLAWVVAAKYMSAGAWYAVFMICETLCLPLLYGAARKAVAA